MRSAGSQQILVDIPVFLAMLVAIAAIALSAFIDYATLLRILRECRR